MARDVLVCDRRDKEDIGQMCVKEGVWQKLCVKDGVRGKEVYDKLVCDRCMTQQSLYV